MLSIQHLAAYSSPMYQYLIAMIELHIKLGSFEGTKHLLSNVKFNKKCSLIANFPFPYIVSQLCISNFYQSQPNSLLQLRGEIMVRDDMIWMLWHLLFTIRSNQIKVWKTLRNLFSWVKMCIDISSTSLFDFVDWLGSHWGRELFFVFSLFWLRL